MKEEKTGTYLEVPWLRRLVAGLSPWRHGFALGSVGFVDKAAMGQGFIRVPRVFLANIISLRLSMLIYHMGVEQ
jgi:hypothetical protein